MIHVHLGHDFGHKRNVCVTSLRCPDREQFMCRKVHDVRYLANGLPRDEEDRTTDECVVVKGPVIRLFIIWAINGDQGASEELSCIAIVHAFEGEE
jgi:hypothetical protein